MLARASSMRAVGCGVFDVATSSMFPRARVNGVLQFDYQDQNHNWSGTSQAPDANNDTKKSKRISRRSVFNNVQSIGELKRIALRIFARSKRMSAVATL